LASGSATRPPYAVGKGTPLRDLDVVDLGLILYAECWDLQNRIAAEVAAGTRPETLLLLEHPHTYTCGRRGGRENILAGDDVLKREGIIVLDVDRGGDVTYHGPGQLVAYPIVNLLAAAPTIDYPGYVRTLETVLVGVLADFAIDAHALEGFSGAWVTTEAGPEKIAAIGVRVDGRGITTHGIALNVAPDLAYFGYIVPCGIADKGVTSIERVAGTAPAVAAAKAAFVRRFAEVFGFQPLNRG
jgi:lipoyl(octanoyl) transferase